MDSSTHTHTCHRNSDANDATSADGDAASVSGFHTRGYGYENDNVEKYRHLSACHPLPPSLARTGSKSSSSMKNGINHAQIHHKIVVSPYLGPTSVHNPSHSGNNQNNHFLKPPEPLRKSRSSGGTVTDYDNSEDSVATYSAYVEPPDGVSYRARSRSAAAGSDVMSAPPPPPSEKEDIATINTVTDDENGLLLEMKDVGSITPRPVHILLVDQNGSQGAEQLQDELVDADMDMNLNAGAVAGAHTLDMNRDVDQWHSSSSGDDMMSGEMRDRTPSDFGPRIIDDGSSEDDDYDEHNKTPLMTGFSFHPTTHEIDSKPSANQRLLRYRPRKDRGKVSIHSMTRDNSISGF